jgi:hypothetical protein
MKTSKRLLLNQPPIAIAITWGKDMLKANGGAAALWRHFLRETVKEDVTWLQKCKNKPKHDVLHVYIIVGNQVRAKMLYLGHQSGDEMVTTPAGTRLIRWPRLVLAGPAELPKCKITMRGFQGFRYLTKELY